MLAMQYTLSLSGDFDEASIRRRVEARAGLFDRLPGMRLKAFLYDVQENAYAPFYVWEDMRAVREFLCSDLFLGVVRSFHRPRVRTWFVLAESEGKKQDQMTPSAYCALRESDRMGPEISMPELAVAELKRQQEIVSNTSVVYYTSALDADRWELVRFSFWANEEEALRHADADCIQCYRVLHLSLPASRPGGEVAYASSS